MTRKEKLKAKRPSAFIYTLDDIEWVNHPSEYLMNRHSFLLALNTFDLEIFPRKKKVQRRFMVAVFVRLFLHYFNKRHLLCCLFSVCCCCRFFFCFALFIYAYTCDAGVRSFGGKVREIQG